MTQHKEGTQPGPGEVGSGCRVFVSYRRDDSADATDRLADALAAHFGPDRIFVDIDNIDLGADFAQVIENWVASCDALVVVIGPRWLTTVDRSGNKRLDDPHDYVRLEVEAGLLRGVRVIPVLIHGAEMPSAEDLPESMRSLQRRNALQIDRKNWRYDVDRLCNTLERIERLPAEAPSSPAEPAPAPAPPAGDEAAPPKSATVRCLKCDTVNDAGAVYCRNCGFSLFVDPEDADRLIEPPRPRPLEVVLEPALVKLLPRAQAQMFARVGDDRPSADLRWELAGAAAGIATATQNATGVEIAVHPGPGEPPARMPLEVRCFDRDELVGEAHGTVEVLQAAIAPPTPLTQPSTAPVGSRVQSTTGSNVAEIPPGPSKTQARVLSIAESLGLSGRGGVRRGAYVVGAVCIWLLFMAALTIHAFDYGTDQENDKHSLYGFGHGTDPTITHVPFWILTGLACLVLITAVASSRASTPAAAVIAVAASVGLILYSFYLFSGLYDGQYGPSHWHLGFYVSLGAAFLMLGATGSALLSARDGRG